MRVRIEMFLEVHRLRDRLHERQVETIAVESTGVHGIPRFEVLAESPIKTFCATAGIRE